MPSTKKDYESNVKSLMDAITTAKTVSRQGDFFREERTLACPTRYGIYQSEKPTLGDWVVYSGVREVHSIGAGNIEVPEFLLQTEDYAKVVKACDERRRTLYSNAPTVTKNK